MQQQQANNKQAQRTADLINAYRKRINAFRSLYAGNSNVKKLSDLQIVGILIARDRRARRLRREELDRIKAEQEKREKEERETREKQKKNKASELQRKFQQQSLRNQGERTFLMPHLTLNMLITSSLPAKPQEIEVEEVETMTGDYAYIHQAPLSLDQEKLPGISGEERIWFNTHTGTTPDASRDANVEVSARPVRLSTINREPKTMRRGRENIVVTTPLMRENFPGSNYRLSYQAALNASNATKKAKAA